MADELVAVRHSSGTDSDDPGLMSKEYFDRFGKDRGYVLVDDQAAAEKASAPPASQNEDIDHQPPPSGFIEGDETL